VVPWQTSLHLIKKSTFLYYTVKRLKIPAVLKAKCLTDHSPGRAGLDCECLFIVNHETFQS